MSFPKFPKTGGPWAECDRCGFEFPQAEMVRDYKTKKLVDQPCADERNHDDYMQELRRRQEGNDVTEQRVHNQGEYGIIPWFDTGAGTGGAGGGGSGGETGSSS